MQDRVTFFLNRLNERLWVRPLGVTLLSIALIFLARLADAGGLGDSVPEIAPESVNTLLSIISASMLVIATFSVASMVSAYASAAGTATPRSFPLIVSDDESQNALSTFIAAFIFSVVALIAVENSYYGRAGRFVLFLLTVLFFVIVIITFVRWVDSIARLGRLGTTIDKAEQATAEALGRRRCAPTLGGVAVGPLADGGTLVHAATVGYVQRVDVPALQAYAEEAGLRITVQALPGAFAAPRQPLARVLAERGETSSIDVVPIQQAFTIAENRAFDEDPRFGLVVLSEIASRALSPGINDPGTAIDVIGRFVRLFVFWGDPCPEEERRPTEHGRVSVPDLSLSDMLDDAFTAIARDGAGTIEVAVRLQEAFDSLARFYQGSDRQVVLHHARQALARAEGALTFPADVERVREAAAFARR